MARKTRKPPLRKNVSQNIRNGTVIMTRDEFFEDHNNYVKPQYRSNSKLYRETVVMETNRQGELAVIKIQSGGKCVVVNKKGQKEKYNPHIKTTDNEGKPIRLGAKFQRGNPNYDVDIKNANQMKREAIKHPSKKVRTNNRNKLRGLKGRKKRNQ